MTMIVWVLRIIMRDVLLKIMRMMIPSDETTAWVLRVTMKMTISNVLTIIHH